MLGSKKHLKQAAYISINIILIFRINMSEQILNKWLSSSIYKLFTVCVY